MALDFFHVLFVYCLVYRTGEGSFLASKMIIKSLQAPPCLERYGLQIAQPPSKIIKTNQ